MSTYFASDWHLDRHEEIKKKIIKMFRSTDKDMNKMGQLLCHKLRINYHVVKFNTIIKTHWIFKQKWFFIDDIQEITSLINIKGLAIYKIELNKSI